MKNTIFPALLCLWLSPMAFGAGFQGFLRLDTINGGSADPNHPGWMDVLSSTTASISKTGVKAVSGGLAFLKPVDGASPALALACARGTNISSGTVDLANTSASLGVVLRLNLTNVVLTSVSIGGSDSTPIESVSLQAQVFSWNYTQFNPASGLALTNVSSIWDFSASTGGYTGSAPGFMTTGIRKTTGVELGWNAAANTRYRIYAVRDLTQPFLPIAQITTTNSGPATYVITPVGPAMFYVVEQLPAGY